MTEATDSLSAAREFFWGVYDRQAASAHASSYRTALTDKFDRAGYHLGALPKILVSAAGHALAQVDCQVFAAADTTPAFVSYQFSASDQAAFNQASRFCRLDARALWTLSEVFDSLKSEVAECLGAPWRILNVRAWSTPTAVEHRSMYGWHTDGFVEEIFKIMIYLTPLSRESGGLEIELEGRPVFPETMEPGAWVLFRNSSLLHRGVAGSDATRLSIEVTLSRAFDFDLRPRTPGLNAHWPAYPFIDAVAGYEPLLSAVDPVMAPSVMTIPPVVETQASKRIERSLLRRVLAAVYRRCRGLVAL